MPKDKYLMHLNKDRVTFLQKLYDFGGKAKCKDLDLDYGERTNSQSTVFWALTRRTGQGEYELTDLGIGFIEGRYYVQKSVVKEIKTGKVLQAQGPQMHISNFFESKTHEERKAESKEPVIFTPNYQMGLDLKGTLVNGRY